MPTKDYREGLLKRLQDPEQAAEYLTACFEDSEEVFLVGLRNVVDAYGGVRKLSKTTKLNRESLYRMLSEEGNPTLASLATILDTIGIHLQFAANAA